MAKEKAMTRVWIFCLLMFSATLSSAQPRAGLSAREILDKTVSVYASCKAMPTQAR